MVLSIVSTTVGAIAILFTAINGWYQRQDVRKSGELDRAQDITQSYLNNLRDDYTNLKADYTVLKREMEDLNEKHKECEKGRRELEVQMAVLMRLGGGGNVQGGT